MLGKETETYAVVINCTRLQRDHYKIELGDAAGEIYELIVHEETVVDYRLVVGKELDKETFDLLQNSMDYQKAYSYAIGILARRMYTEKEIRRKLYERETAADIICDVVAKLFEIEVLNDVIYATAYIENQVEMGRKSRRQIISDLRIKGVSANIIDDLRYLFDKESENALIVKEIEKAYGRYSRKELSDFEMQKRVVQALGRKGFEIDEVQREYGYFIEDLAVVDDEL